jgi:hypothetical protein
MSDTNNLYRNTQSEPRPRFCELEPTRAAKLEAQLREAINCLKSDDAEGLSRSLAEVTRQGFTLVNLRLRAQRRRASDLLRKLHGQKDRVAAPTPPTSTGPSPEPL